MEYLKIVQDLDMYGVNYFPIKVNKFLNALRVAYSFLNFRTKGIQNFGLE